MKKYFSMLLILFSCCPLYLPPSATNQTFLKKTKACIASTTKEGFLLSGRILKRATVITLGSALAYGTIAAILFASKQLHMLPQGFPITPTQLKTFFGTTVPTAVIQAGMKSLETVMCPRIKNIDNVWIKTTGLKNAFDKFLNCGQNT